MIGLYSATGGSGGYGLLSNAGPGTVYIQDSTSGVTLKKIYCDNANLGNYLLLIYLYGVITFDIPTDSYFSSN